jgi:hypothetical protein
VNNWRCRAFTHLISKRFAKEAHKGIEKENSPQTHFARNPLTNEGTYS